MPQPPQNPENISFYSAFFRTALWRPGQAFTALYWHLTGRKLRARNRLRMAVLQSPSAYRQWISDVEQADKTLAEASRIIADWAYKPLFSVIVAGAGSTEALPEQTSTQTGLESQCYPEWEVITAPDADPAGALAAGLAAARGDYVLLLPAGAMLPPSALYHYAAALQHARQAVLLYGDHDEISPQSTRQNPWFKPQWNPDLFLAQDYVTMACAVQTQAAREALAAHPAQPYGLLLAVTGAGREDAPQPQILHIPHILAHLPGPAGGDQPARLAAVARHLAGTGAGTGADTGAITGATVHPGPFDSLRVDWPLPDAPPLVSIIIPSRDQARLLQSCVDGVLAQTRYGAFEIIIVDNGSTQPAALAYLDHIAKNPRVRVLRYNHPFNFAAINNFAARHAAGEYLCLLNNDIEVTDADWLTALMRQAIRPQVGAVGAKLLYDDGCIQHAGVVIGLGGAAGHAHRFQPNAARGYFARAHLAHRVSAVTAACLVVAKSKFDAVGGLDEDSFAVAFNDVDLCLKLQAADWHNIYEPRACLIHHESKSRGGVFSPAPVNDYAGELAMLQQRWAARGFCDPLHHPQLDRQSETYRIALRE